MRLWHRRISLFLFVWIFFVALTGIGLNHSEDFGLDSTSLPNPVLKTIYDIDPPDVTSFYLQGNWISVVGGQQLYVNAQTVGYCNNVAGLAAKGSETYIGCIDSVYVLNSDGEVIEQLNARFGLPVPLEEFGSCNNLPCLVSGGSTFVLDPDKFIWAPTSTELLSLSASKTPEGLQTKLQQQNSPQDFHLERLIRDLHSGLFFGLGPWLMDLFAGVLMALAITGFIVWWLTRRK